MYNFSTMAMYKNYTEMCSIDALQIYIQQKCNDKILSIIQNTDPCHFTDGSGTTLLHIAAKYGNTDIVRSLIDLGLNVDAKNQKKETALMWAVEAFQEEVIKSLLESNADLLLPDVDGQCALGKAFNKFKGRFTYESLINTMLNHVKIESLKSSDYVRSKVFHKSCPLYYFVQLNNVELLRILLEMGSPVDAKDQFTRETALHKAVQQFHAEIVKFLIDNHANVNARNDFGETPLALLSNFENQSETLEVLNLFIKAGAKLIDCERQKIMVSSLLSRGNQKIIRRLLQCKIDLRYADLFGYTPIFLLAQNKNVGILEELENYHTEDVKLLQEARLHNAAKKCNVTYVKYFLDLGINVDAKNTDNYTTLRIVINEFIRKENYTTDVRDFMNCIEFLLQRGADPQIISEQEIIFRHRWGNIFTHEIFKPIFGYLAILETSGGKINQQMKNVIRVYPHIASEFELNKLHLQEMKEIYIDKTTSLMDFLIANEKQIWQYARNRKLVSNLANKMKEWDCNSYCRCKVNKRFLKFEKLIERREKCVPIMDELFREVYDRSLFNVAEKIVDYSLFASALYELHPMQD